MSSFVVSDRVMARTNLDHDELVTVPIGDVDGWWTAPSGPGHVVVSLRTRQLTYRMLLSEASAVLVGKDLTERIGPAESVLPG